MTALTVYVGALVAAAGVCVLVVVATERGLGDVWVVACLAAVAAVAERGGVRLTPTTEVSISLVPTLLAAVLFGPLAAVLVAAASMLSDLYSRSESQPYLRWATYTSTRVIAAASVGFIALAAQAMITRPVVAIAVATGVGALVAASLDISFASLTGYIRGKASVGEVVAAVGPLTLASVSLYAPVVAIVAGAYLHVSPLTLPLFLFPALAAQRLHAMYHRQRALTSDLLEANAALECANLSFASALVATLDARDRYTAGHSNAVAVYARDTAARMGLSAREQELAYLCGLVHDIGKIGLPPGLLEKEGPLTLEERRLMQEHSAIGERILQNVQGYEEIAAAVRHHHERVDGEGYPDNLAGDDIPLLARLISVADAYDAMTSHRPYRDAMPSHVARLRIAQAVGSQFDTSVVAAFEAILASSSEAYRSGRATRSRELPPAGNPEGALPRPLAVLAG